MSICVSSVDGIVADEKHKNSQIVKISQYSHAMNSYERCWGYLASDLCSTPHLTEELHTLNALCSGMLVLEATTTRIKQGYFSPSRKSPRYLGKSRRSLVCA